MTDDQKTALRLVLLQTLRAAGELGLPDMQLLTAARVGGHADLTRPELLATLRDLADDRAVAPFSQISGRRWRITALGESQLAEAGL